jgi:hypothetical protein
MVAPTFLTPFRPGSAIQSATVVGIFTFETKKVTAKKKNWLVKMPRIHHVNEDLAHGEDPPTGFSVMASSFGFDIRSGREAIDIEKLARIDLDALLTRDRTSVFLKYIL